jgi:uncharacterized protein (DUF169 family)
MLKQNDRSILNQLGLENPPVGVKYLTRPPRKTARLDKNLALCEMLKAAFEGDGLYTYIPKISDGVVKYIALSPLPKMVFDPDVLIILATTTQAEILLRAMSYETGRMWHSRYSSAIGCAWLFAYPYLNGEINFIPTGLGFGMRRRKLFPEGRQFISIPFDRLPSMLETLRTMPWIPRAYRPDGLEHVKRLRKKLGLDRP